MTTTTMVGTSEANADELFFDVALVLFYSSSFGWLFIVGVRFQNALDLPRKA